MENGTVEAAARWCARLRADDCTERDRQLFHEWMEEHPSHREVFSLMAGVWGGAAAFGPQRAQGREGAPTRRAALVGGLAFGAVLFGLPSRPAEAMVIRTGIGEHHSLVRGRATFLLDTRTELILPRHPASPKGRLVYGRMALDIPASARTGWRLKAGSCALFPSAGKFDFLLTADEFSTTVLDGALRVDPFSDGHIHTLTEGERLRFGPGESPVLDRPRLDDLTAWREGRVVFRDTPLAAAVAEMNRYSERHIEIVSPDVAALQIRGIYHTANVTGFLHALTRLLPVRVEDGKVLRIVKL